MSWRVDSSQWLFLVFPHLSPLWRSLVYQSLLLPLFCIAWIGCGLGKIFCLMHEFVSFYWKFRNVCWHLFQTFKANYCNFYRNLQTLSAILSPVMNASQFQEAYPTYVHQKCKLIPFFYSRYFQICQIKLFRLLFQVTFDRLMNSYGSYYLSYL
jgi:hypothetical protein